MIRRSELRSTAMGRKLNASIRVGHKSLLLDVIKLQPQIPGMPLAF
jgi:hypothetical protein